MATDPKAELEETFIREFLLSRGLDADALAALDAEQRAIVMSEALKYAAVRLTEVEARAHFVHELHGDE